MTEQHIVLIAAICKRLNRASKKQMTRWKLALEFSVQPLRLAFGRIIPTAWQCRTIGWLRLHAKCSMQNQYPGVRPKYNCGVAWSCVSGDV